LKKAIIQDGLKINDNAYELRRQSSTAQCSAHRQQDGIWRWLTDGQTENNILLFDFGRGKDQN